MNPPEVRAGRSHGTRYAPFLFFLLGLGLSLAFRLPTLGDLSWWYDEALTGRTVDMGWADLVNDRRFNGHFPTYFALLKLLGLGGASEFALRLPTAIFASLAGGVTTIIGWRIGGALVAAGTAVIYALSPFLINFGMEARPYGMLLLFTTVAMTGQIALLGKERHTGAATILASVGTLGSVLTIPAGGLVVLTQHLALFFCGFRRLGPAQRRGWLVHILITWIGIIGAAAFLFGTIVEQAKAPNGLLKWQAAMTFYEKFSWVFSQAFNFALVSDTMHYVAPTYWLAPILLVGFALVGLFARRREPTFRYLGFISVASPLLLLVIGGFAVIASRYLVGMMPAFVLLSASGIGFLLSNPRRRFASAIAVAVLLVALALQARDMVAAPNKYDWKRVAAFVRDNDIRDAELVSDDYELGIVLSRYVPASYGLRYKMIYIPPDTIESAWALARSRDLSWLLLSNQYRPPENISEGRVLCRWSFGAMTMNAIVSDRNLLPPSLRDCPAD